MLCFICQCKYNIIVAKIRLKKIQILRHIGDFKGLTQFSRQSLLFSSMITVKPGQAYPPRFHQWIYLLLIRNLNPWVVVDSSLHSCMCNEPWIHTWFSYEISTSSWFPWIWCKCLLRNFIHSKIFNLTNCRQVLVKYSLLITHTGMPRIGDTSEGNN